MAVLHPHVGGWTETEHEVRTVLDGIGRELLAFGPDTGHMSWAGMDVVGILREYAGRVLREYAGRIVGVHVKDTFSAGIDRAKALDLDYRDATRPGRIRAEPGTGQLDLEGCVEAIGSDYTGDYMIEVDVPTVPLKRCHQLAYDWAIATVPLATLPLATLPLATLPLATLPLATLPLATLPLPTRPLGTRSR